MVIVREWTADAEPRVVLVEPEHIRVHWCRWATNARLLCGLGGMVKNGTIVFPFTQQHLADTLGMSLVHTNKTLKRLLALKAIRWKDRVFEMVDRAALAAIAGEDIGPRRERPFI